MARRPKFYLNMRTGQVEEGKVSSWAERMGPYPSREAAEEAFDRAQHRNEAWAAEERAWREDWDEK